MGEWALPEWFGPNPQCPKCGGSGYVRDGSSDWLNRVFGDDRSRALCPCNYDRAPSGSGEES